MSARVRQIAEIGGESVERRVLDIVGALVAELGGRPVAVTLDDSLERSLGIGSLERVELLLRIEETFGVRLADAMMAEAETPRDLVTAILSAAPAAPEAVPAIRPMPGVGVAAPESVRTLVEALAWHADADPARIHVFLREEDGRERPISYGELARDAAAVAAGLRARGIEAGDHVAIMLRSEPAFFPAFFGTLMAGGVPVPIYPPFRPERIEEYGRRQIGILDNAEARLLVTFSEAERVANVLRARVPSLAEVTVIDRLARAGAPAPGLRLGADDPALIQYTSGSTGDPKGVLLTHANLLANIRAIGAAIAIRPDDTAVSWLPLYHDMGLIGSWLGALYFGVPIVIMSPLAFLSRPSRWLVALHAHRGTISPAPNFAFDLCVRKVRDEEIPGLDLSAWRLAFNGSEPVSPETIERFTARFAPFGFRPEAMVPVYGLAESSVALTVPALGRPPRIDRVSRETFQRTRRARPAAPDEPAPLFFVACGRPLRGHEVRIVDAAGEPVGERVEGRIEFRGPSVSAGYFRNPAATRAVLHDGWMDSGDLGYWGEADLFITGRSKDIIIKAGRNLYPQEVEEMVADIPGIRKGCVAAFGVSDPEIGTERLVVVAESRDLDPAGRERLRATVVDRVVTALGIPPDIVQIAAPGAVLKTSSGKIRRSATREAYLRGETARARPSPRVQWVRLLAADLVARARRLGPQAARLAYGAHVGVLLGLTMPALWGLVLLLPPRAVDRVVRGWCRRILALAGCPVRVEGRANLAGPGPFVLATNHSSYLDAVVLLATIPVDFRFVAKRELLAAWFVGSVIHKIGHLTVERVDVGRSVADAQRVTEALRGGVSLLFFPEGTFRRAPGFLPFRLGAFKAAVETSRPVVPVAISGTREILPAYRWLPTPGPVTVSIGPPLVPRNGGWPEMVRLRDLARDEIARLVTRS